MQLYVEADARARPETDIGAVGSARAWAEPNFRLYWMSHGLMLLATQTNLLATQWLVLDQTASRTMLGVVPLIQGVVVAAFSAMGGIAADRLPRRDLLAAGRLLAVPVELGLAALAWFGVIHYWHAFIGVGLTALILAIIQPASQTYVYDLVGRARLLNAVALTSAATSLFQVAGPAVSAVLLSIAGVTGNYLLAGVALALGGLFLLPIPERGLNITSPVDKRHSWAMDAVGDFAAGVRAAQRGRISSLYFLVMQAVFIGQFAAGVLADHIDVTATMIAAGAFRLMLLLVLLWVAIPVRRFALQPAV